METKPRKMQVILTLKSVMVQTIVSKPFSFNISWLFGQTPLFISGTSTLSANDREAPLADVFSTKIPVNYDEAEQKLVPLRPTTLQLQEADTKQVLGSGHFDVGVHVDDGRQNHSFDLEVVMKSHDGKKIGVSVLIHCDVKLGRVMKRIDLE